MTPTPPKGATWLLARRLSGEWLEYVLGDLEEEFHSRAASSPAAARRWYWRQAIRGFIAPIAAARAPQSKHASRRDPLMTSLLIDLRLAVRMLRRAPGFAAAVIGVLALGIAANTAIFSLVNTVLLRPLPFDEPERLVRLYHTPPQNAFPGMTRFALSQANFDDWKREAKSFDKVASYGFRQFTLTGLGKPEAMLAGALGPDFFDVVRTAPKLGRTFRADEDLAGRSHVAIVSEGFWNSHLGADRRALGRQLILNGTPYELVGVMPAKFSAKAWGATSVDLWVPKAPTDEERRMRDNHNEQGIGRLKAGVTLAEAQAELSGIAKRLEAVYPKENAGWGAVLIPLHELIVGDTRLTLLMLLGAVVLLLLIACANVGNLMFTRAIARHKEIAIRSALGAGRGRVFQQLMVEAGVLSLLGGALGLLCAQAALSAGGALLATQIPRADELALDGRVLLFSVFISLLTGVLAGALPALRAGRADLNDALKEGGRNDSSAAGLRTRRVLIVCEVALSLMLLMGAAVMIRSLSVLRHVDTGFTSSNVLTMRVMLPGTKYDTPAKRTAFFDGALERLRALPGVESAGAVDDLPTQGGSVQPIVIEGTAEQLPSEQPTVQVRQMTPGYLRAMKIPVIRGRDVHPSDTEVMVVSESAAKLLWKDRDPVGQHATLPLMSRTLSRPVIGIVGDVKQEELSSGTMPTIYWYTRERDWRGLTLVMRTASAPMSLSTAASAALLAMDPDQPIEDIRAMDTILDDSLRARRFSTLLLALFAGVALALASVGIYTVLAFIVRGRRREIGIRTALGAKTSDVLRMVMFEGMAPALVGIVLGAAASFGSARLLRQLVFEISPTDPITLAVVAGVLALVALLASVVPAYSAAKIDPLKVLR
jgi:putative ABC transport system permease protein